jgi:hypothetical protein
MTAPPKRRWFRFGLGTMFVAVTIAACGLGYVMWQWRIVQERKAILNSAIKVTFTPANMLKNGVSLPIQGASVPWLRRQLGDRPICELSHNPTHTVVDHMGNVQVFAELDPRTAIKVTELFPEAVWTFDNVVLSPPNLHMKRASHVGWLWEVKPGQTLKPSGGPATWRDKSLPPIELFDE